jgi:hypothetical protein
MTSSKAKMPAREIRGAIHVHSNYSDGTGTVEEIIAAAQAAQLDFIILTDHDNSDAAKDGYGGRYGKVLLVVGAEVSPPRGGHCLALGAQDVDAYRWMPEKHYLRRLRRQNADIYVAHPEGRVKATFGINLRQWHIWESEHFDGIEIWSYMHDWVERLSLLNIPMYYLSPDSAIAGPNEKVLGLWDRLNLHRRVAGIGALDAHAVKMGLGLFTAFKYEFLFGTILTHALVDDWGSDAEADTLRLRAALKEARAFVAYDRIGRADGFRFSAEGLAMGDTAAVGGGIAFDASLPESAEIALIHNGRRVAAESGTAVRFPASEPGVYRLEARREGRPWIFSNPICLK